MDVLALPTLDEILAELTRRDAAVLEGYFTVEEWAERLRVPHSRARRLLLKAKEQGKLLIARRPIEGLDGRSITVPVYAFWLKKGG